MSQIKISNLTTWTGSPTDIRWYIMNNESNTETYKFSGYTAGLIPGTGTNSIKSNLTATPATASGEDSIAIGRDAKAQGQDTIAIGRGVDASGFRNIKIGTGGNYSASDYSIGIGFGIYSVSAPNSIQIGYDTATVGQNTLVVGQAYNGIANRSTAEGAITLGGGNANNEGYRSVVLGNFNKISGGLSYNAILGNNNQILVGNYNQIIGGTGNIMSGTTSGTTLIGLTNFTSPAENDTTYVKSLYVVGDGSQARIKTNSSSIGIGDVGNINTTNQYAFGYNNGVGNGQKIFNFSWENNAYLNGNYAIGIGKNSNQGGNYHIQIGQNNQNNGGTDMTQIGRNINTSASVNNVIGIGTDINLNSDSSIVLGKTMVMSSTGTNNSIIGGSGNTLSGTTSGTTLIGLTNFTSPTNDNTTYVDNIHTLRVESFDVVSGGSVGGNIDVDCSLGTIFTFTITANTTPNFINFRDGQRITFVVTNTTYSVPSATIDGGGSVYAKNGSISPSNNSKTLYYGTFISGDLYIDEHTGFSAV